MVSVTTHLSSSHQTMGWLVSPCSVLRVMHQSFRPDLAFKTHAGVQGPLRCGKASTWDGGQRVPGIAWWPGKIRHGRTQEVRASHCTYMKLQTIVLLLLIQLAATLDLFPTVMKLAGGKMPSVITDGIDMSPILFENKKVEFL